MYEAGRVMFDDAAQAVARIPDTVCWDWMHNLLASGGTCQYEISAFIRRMIRLRVRGLLAFTLQDLDDFSGSITWKRVLLNYRRHSSQPAWLTNLASTSKCLQEKCFQQFLY